MENVILLIDYADIQREFLIKDFENVLLINIEVISGDEVATIIYKDYSTIAFDSGSYRLAGFYDGSYFIKPDLIDEFNNLKVSSYDRLDYFIKRSEK